MPRFVVAAHLGRPWHTLLAAVYESALRFGEGSIGEKWGKIAGGSRGGRMQGEMD
jgi:hypothetical protein